MSENQYEPKFVAAAKRKPIAIPCVPPSFSPMNRSNALSTPSNSAVLTVLDIGCLFYAPDEPRDEGGAGGHGFDVYVFMEGVGAVANRPQAV